MSWWELWHLLLGIKPHQACTFPLSRAPRRKTCRQNHLPMAGSRGLLRPPQLFRTKRGSSEFCISYPSKMLRLLKMAGDKILFLMLLSLSRGDAYNLHASLHQPRLKTQHFVFPEFILLPKDQWPKWFFFPLRILYFFLKEGCFVVYGQVLKICVRYFCFPENSLW